MVFIVIFIDTGQPCLEHKSSLGVWSSGIEIACHSDNVAFHPLLTLQPTFPPPTPPLHPTTLKANLANLNLWDMCRGRLSYQEQTSPYLPARLVSLLSTSSKLEIDFCLELKGLRPFQCLSSVCVCACVWVWVSACVHVCARRCMCTCLWPLSVCRWVWICVSVRVCRCYLCNWI